MISIFDLRDEVDHVGGAAVDLLLAAGAAEALHLGDGHAVHADLGERFLHLVELEGLDDGLDLLHRWAIYRARVSGVFLRRKLAAAAPRRCERTRTGVSVKLAAMPKRERYLFVCQNERPADNPKGSCRAKGSKEIYEALKVGLVKRGLRKRLRVCESSCLDLCWTGPSIAVMPDRVFYGEVTLGDVEPILDSLERGDIVERLVVPDRLFDDPSAGSAPGSAPGSAAKAGKD